MAAAWLEQAALSDASPEARVFTEPRPPYRIVHVNQAWLQATGYTADEAVGKTCAILQGSDTCERTKQVRLRGRGPDERGPESATAAHAPSPSPPLTCVERDTWSVTP